MHFRRTGTLPDAVADPTFAAQTKAAFSSNPGHDFEEDEEDFRSGRGGRVPPPPRSDRDEDYALLQQNEADEMGGRHAMHGAYDPTAPAPAPGGVLHDYNNSPYNNNNPYGNPTGYGGAHGQHYVTPSEYGSSLSGYGR